MTPRTAFTALCLGLASAAVPAADPDFASVKRLAADGSVVETPLVGRADAGRKGQVLRTDGVVVGFDVAVSKFFDNDWIVAVRPLYRTPSGVLVGEMAGEFDTYYHVDNGIRRAGIKERQLLAKAGYAVAEVHVMSGLHVDHFSLTYARTTANGLDLTDTYKSEAIGKDATNWVQTTKAGDRFAVGVNFRQERGILRAVGLIHLKDEAASPPPPPRATWTTGYPVAIPKLIPVIPQNAPKATAPTPPTAGRPAHEPGAVPKENPAPDMGGPVKKSEPAPNVLVEHTSEPLGEGGIPTWAYAAGTGALVLLLLCAFLVLRRGSNRRADEPRRRSRAGRTGDDVLDELDDPQPARRGRDRQEIDVDDLFDDAPPARPFAPRPAGDDDVFADPAVPLQPAPGASAEEMIVPDDGPPPPPPAPPPVARPVRARPIK